MFLVSANLNGFATLKLVVSRIAVLTVKAHNDNLFVVRNARAHDFCNAIFMTIRTQRFHIHRRIVDIGAQLFIDV